LPSPVPTACDKTPVKGDREEKLACCAFAAFILSQIILGLDEFRVRIGLTAREANAINPNAIWRLGDVVTQPAKKRYFRPYAIGLTGGLVALGVTLGALLGGPDHADHISALNEWCRSSSLLDF